MQKFTLGAARLPRILAELIRKNEFLTIFSIVALSVAALSTCLAILLVIRPPQVITLNTDGVVLNQVHPVAPEIEVRAALQRYFDLRYKWQPNSVQMQLAQAEDFILPSYTKVYQKSVANVARFSIDKQVSQRAYANSIEVNLAGKTAVLRGDRITAIQGLRAAGDLKIELSFDSGPRTKENSWGVYVTKEREL